MVLLFWESPRVEEPSCTMSRYWLEKSSMSATTEYSRTRNAMSLPCFELGVKYREASSLGRLGKKGKLVGGRLKELFRRSLDSRPNEPPNWKPADFGF